MSSQQLVQQLAQLAGIDIYSDITVLDERFYDEVLSGGSLALGETYMKGWWRSNLRLDELATRIGQARLTDKFREQSWVQQGKIFWSYLSNRLTSSLEHLWVNWGIQNSKEVATEHYDLGNELYRKMLDPTMNYSCGYFRQYQNLLSSIRNPVLYEQSSPETIMSNLEQGQLQKMELIRLKLQLNPDDRILDLGCGWGALSNYLSSSGFEVDAITISQEQFDLAKAKYPQVNFLLMDYRKLVESGQVYDAVVSVGMFEHVNPPHYREYMDIVHKILKPGGIFLLHTIGGNVSKIVGDAWITRYIFPHSCLPSMAQLTASTEKLFVIEDVHNIGPHYDLTLQSWYYNFRHNLDLINTERINNGRNPFDEVFCRMWEYYLLMCAGMFRSRQCQLYQVVLTKDRTGIYIRPSY